MEVPKGPLKIARRFNAGYQATPGQVPKGRLKEAAGKSAQSSLRDADGIDGIPGVETPGYCRMSASRIEDVTSSQVNPSLVRQRYSRGSGFWKE